MTSGTSRVLTLVFTDLADSTALKTARGDVAVGELIARHREHVTRLAQECAGRVIDWAGDGCFLTFETSSAGVMFALRLQQVHADDPDLPGVRVGIHMGEVTEKPNPEGGESHPIVEGLAVDIAARISGLAKPGQILMSSAVHASARQRLGVDALGKPILWQAHGTYELKGFDQPVDIGEAGLEGFAPLEAPRSAEKARLIRRAKQQKVARSADRRTPAGMGKWLAMAALIVAIGIVAYVLGSRQTAPQQDGTVAPERTADAGPITSIAVLPLDNLSGDPEQEYFSDGMTEAITAELANIKALKVISRTSVMQYKDTTKTMRQIAEELGVDVLIEGSVLRDGDDVRITVQLIDGRSDAHLWAESYTNTLTSVLRLQSDVALEIADRIRTDLSAEERSEIADARLVDPEAYEAYLRGNFFYYEYTEDSLNKSAEAFSRAIELDPQFAAAHARLAMALWAKGWFYEKTEEDNARKQRAIADALALDPNNDDARVMAAWTALVDRWDWDQAEREIRTALELNPNNPDAHNMLGWYYYSLARFDDAIAAIELAIELDPLSLAWNTFLADFMLARGQLEASLEQVEAVLELDSAYFQAVAIKGRILHHMGRTQEASEYLESRLAATNRHPNLLSLLADIAADEGRFDRVRAIARELRRAYERGSAAPTHLVQVYAALSEWDDVNEWMERASATRDNANVLPHYPADHRLWGHPRFNALLDRMNYPGPYPEASEDQSRTEDAPIKKIAVLPFTNMMNDPEQEYFVDGMTEALITELAQIRSLQVRGRTTVMRFKGTDKSIAEIARELDVDGIIEGSVLREGDQVRITAQLIHGPTDTHRWAGSFDSTVTSVLKLHSEMALAITKEISANLTPQEIALVAEAEDVVAAAYEEYLMGKFFHFQQSPDGFKRAAEHFRRATELDPGFADAYSWLASALWAPSNWGWTHPLEHLREARAAVNTALALTPQSDSGLGELAWMKIFYDYDLAEAERLFRQAIEFNPDEMAHYWGLAAIYCLRGNKEEALAEANRAVTLDPFNPSALDALGDVHKVFGDYETEIAYRKRILEMEPEHVGHMWNLAEAYSASGRHEEALDTQARVLELMGRTADAWDAAYHARAGLADKAREILADLESPDIEIYVDPFGVAMTYAALGEKEVALDWMERAEDEHSYYLTVSQTRWLGPYIDPFRDEPRFQAIVEKMNIPTFEHAN